MGRSTGHGHVVGKRAVRELGEETEVMIDKPIFSIMDWAVR
ncbi:hypothetical protein [Protofrankia coriariae]|nr:hypothetical protein [Protofrankia coriariae]